MIRLLNSPNENVYISAQGIQLIISKIDEDSTDELLKTISSSLSQSDLHPHVISNTYCFPHWMQLFSKLLGCFGQLSFTNPVRTVLSEIVCQSSVRVNELVQSERDRFEQIAFVSSELEQIDEFAFTSVVLAFVKSALITNDTSIDTLLDTLTDNDEFLTHVLLSDDSFMIEFISTLIGLDRVNLLDADFVQIFVTLLAKVNYDVELFLNLLLESDSVRMISLLILIYKTDNIVDRFNGYLPQGEFIEWTRFFIQKIDKIKHHFPFNPAALLRTMKSVMN